MSKTILAVEDMSCPSCISHVKAALAIPGVTAVEVELDEGLVTVEHEPTVAAGRLIAALSGAGYEATPRDQRGNGVTPPITHCCG